VYEGLVEKRIYAADIRTYDRICRYVVEYAQMCKHVLLGERMCVFICLSLSMCAFLYAHTLSSA
jgi:hypothetical protein